MRMITVLLLLAVSALAAQESTPRFEVASVKHNVSAEPGFGGPPSTAGTRPTGFTAVNVTLERLISIAYQLELNPLHPGDQILGGPGWVRTQRFDVAANAGKEISRDQANMMLRTLLEERFKLVVAREQRGQQAYTLRLAREDRRLGPDLRKAADDCERAKPKDPLALLKLMPRPSNGAGPSISNVCVASQNVAGAIATTLNATVIDETGLTGRWDFVISHAGLQSGFVRGPNGMEERPSIFVAMQEQLGLKLERRHEPGTFEVLVIKSIEQPSEN